MKKNDNVNEEQSINEKIVEITWWAFPNFEVKDGVIGKYEQEIASAFMAKNPNIKVNVEMLSYENGEEKINYAIESNSTPDVLYDSPGRIINYGKKGILQTF